MKMEMKKMCGVSPTKVLKIYHLRDVWHDSYRTIANRVGLKEMTVRKLVENDSIDVVNKIVKMKYKQKMSYRKIAERCNLPEDRLRETISLYKEKFDK